METYTNFVNGEQYTIKIEYDETEHESPRTWDNLGTLLCWHRRYNLGDINILPEQAEEYLADFNWDDYIWLPVYIYDHGMITLRTTSFGDPWDSGQVGIIYVEKKKVRELYKVKRISSKLYKMITDILIEEIIVLDDYVTGNMIYIQLYKGDEFIDSVGGIYRNSLNSNEDLIEYLDIDRELKKQLSIAFKDARMWV